MALASRSCLFPLILSFPGAMLAFQVRSQVHSLPLHSLTFFFFFFNNCEILGHRQTHEGMSLETGATLNARNLQSPRDRP